MSLRGKDIAVLQAIHGGASDISEIREATTLTNREINYSLTEKSLEDLGLVKITRFEGREWMEVAGQERNIWKPKQVGLTDEGIQALSEASLDDRFKDMNKRELIEKVRELEHRQNRLETVFKDFRSNVMERI